MRLALIGLAIHAACATTGAPRARVEATPVACFGHGVIDAGDCLCFPGYKGEKCDSTGGAFAKVLLAFQDPNQSDAWIQSARQERCKYVATLTVAAAYGEISKLDALLAGHPLGECDSMDMSSPMLWSAVTGAAESVRYLLAHHVKADSVSAQGYSPLMTAARLDRLDIVRLLVDAGADINAASKQQETAVTEACSRGHLDAVRWLVEHGADLSIAGEQGTSALSMSVSAKNPALLAYVIEQLKKRHAEPWHCYQALDYAAMSASRATLTQIYQTCSEPETFSTAGPSALFGAALVGMTENLEWLLDAGLDPNAALEEPSEQSAWSLTFEGTGKNAPASLTGMTLLVAAAASGNLTTVEAVLRRGVSVTGRTREGLTALMAACAHGDIDVVKRLIEAGADVDSQTFTDKFTALMYAARRGTPEIVRMLLAAGAATSPENDQGLTALDLARSEDNTEVMEVLDQATPQP